MKIPALTILLLPLTLTSACNTQLNYAYEYYTETIGQTTNDCFTFALNSTNPKAVNIAEVDTVVLCPSTTLCSHDTTGWIFSCEANGVGAVVDAETMKGLPASETGFSFEYITDGGVDMKWDTGALLAQDPMGGAGSPTQCLS